MPQAGWGWFKFHYGQIVQQAVGQLQSIENQPIETEFALRDINKPMGVSEFQLTEILPDELKSSLPSIEEIENELKKLT